MTKKKILIICQHFVPYTPAIGGVARVLALVDFLHKSGVEVFVLTSDGVDFGYLGYEGVKEKAHIFYLRDTFKISMQKAVRQQYVAEQSNKKAVYSRFLKWIKSFIFELLVPDPGVLVRKAYFSQACNLIEQHGIENVLVTSPPHSMQLIGAALKKHFASKINLIVDYRDSWNGRRIFRQKTWLGRKVAERMERNVLRHCDWLTYVSAPMLAKVERIAGIPLDAKARLVMNGFDDAVALDHHQASPPKVSTENSKVRIGHFGIINDEDGSYRDIRRLFVALHDNRALAEKIELHFYGQAKLTGKYKLPGVAFHDNLPYKQAREKMLEMDYLLLYHATSEDSDEVITGKFFEYVASKKPMICLSPVDMEARRLIEKWNMGYVVDVDSPDAIRQLLLNLEKPMEDQFYSDCDISEFSRSKQNQKIIELLR